MTAKDIITLPDERLRTKSRRIGAVSAEAQAIAEGMIEATLEWEAGREHEFGAALAAVQVGLLERIIVVRHDFDNKADKSFGVFINPEIVKTDGELEEDLEGCLSVKDIYGSVKRYTKVKIKAINLEGKPVRLTATGFLARVFQHEIDHTNGIVFVDRVNDPHNLYRLEADGKFSPLPPPEAAKAIASRGETH
ncbi:peptide deformylase [Candidatus Saccharibacteria bacterium]|nr:peptide deformylase [Candidatus Saccharibacteria bacterium]